MGAPMVLLLICIMISVCERRVSEYNLTAMLFDCYAETSERAMHDASIGHFRPDGLASPTDDRHLYLGSPARFAAAHHVSHRLGQQVRHLFLPDLNQQEYVRDIDETLSVYFFYQQPRPQGRSR